MNNDRIIERIKNLMKDKYFYYKDDLIKKINLYKEYPIEQIDYALTQLVNEKNEFIVDKLNRLGHLINIEDLYVFQPIELTNENISIYDRNRPISYKRDQIYLESKSLNNLLTLKDDKISNEPTAKISDEKLEKLEDSEANKIITHLKKLYDTSTQDQLVLRGEKNFYKYYSLVYNELSKTISKDLLDDFLIAHLLEMLSYDDSLILVNYLFYLSLNDFEKKLKKYYESQILTNGKISGLLITDKDKQKLIIKNARFFTLAESEDYVDLQQPIKSLIIKIEDFNNIVGFIGDFKNDYNIFKVKFLNKKRHKGARCDQSSKKEAIEVLNKILENETFTSANTSSMNQIQICIYQEMYLRYFDYLKKNNKHWFLTPSQAIVNNIEKISNI
jgi:hypothetical protein